MKKFVFLSYDLGVTGDYEGLYRWLDKHGAKECGDALAGFTYEAEHDLIEELKADIEENVELNEKKDRIYLIRIEDGKVKGKFILGNRRSAPWAGSAGVAQDQDDE